MADSAFSLLATRRFAPLFITQFLGAMNDNVFKNALIILTLFELSTGESAQVLVTIAAGVFVLPFLLFSATAGQLADKYEKAGLIRRIKFAEIVIMALGTAGLYLGDTTLLLGVLFLTGAQSTFFGPLKYGIMPEHLGEHELIGGNALIEAGTFIAILVGTIVGGLFVLGEHGLTIIASIVLGLAVLGWIASHTIPKAPPTAVGIEINPNFVAETWRIILHAKARWALFLPILGISWFWLMAATFLTQFPNLTTAVLGGDETVVTLLLMTFAIGIGIGALLCTVVLGEQVSVRFVPLAGAAISAFIADLFFALSDRAASGTLTSAAAFVVHSENWRVLLDVAGIAIACGLFCVPLYATLQNESTPEHRARNAAANNVVNSFFMVVGALWAAVMLAAGITVPVVLLWIGIGNAAVVLYIRGLLRRSSRDRQARSTPSEDRRIWVLAGLVTTIVLLALFVPRIPQDPAYHLFADIRTCLGIPRFGDVVSNLPFLVVGVVGLHAVSGVRSRQLFAQAGDELPYRIFFAAVLMIGFGSIYYHLQPDNERLLWDRLPMAVAFMAFFAAFVADRVDRTLGLSWVLPAGIALGIASLVYWIWSEGVGRGDLRPYGLIQFASIVFLPALCWLYPAGRYTDGRYLAMILLVYALAKVYEFYDREIFMISGELIGGHALKHLAAAVACYLPLAMIRSRAAEARRTEDG